MLNIYHLEKRLFHLIYFFLLRPISKRSDLSYCTGSRIDLTGTLLIRFVWWYYHHSRIFALEIRRLRISFSRSLESSTTYGTETLPSYTGDRSTGRRRAHAAPTAFGSDEPLSYGIVRRSGRSGTSRTVVHSLGRASDFRGHQSLSPVASLWSPAARPTPERSATTLRSSRTKSIYRRDDHLQ